MFVDNLPSSMTKARLWQIFKFEGRIIDIYISRKVRKTLAQPFAFMRWRTKEDAVRAVKNINGQVVRDCLIEVKEAEFKRGTNNRVLHNTIDGDELKNLPGGSCQKADNVVGRTCKDS